MTTDIERAGIDVGHSHEPSYYEIALTNRQVVVAFVILLVCVVASFLSGVWIGRESTVRAQEKAALQSQRAAAEAAEKNKGEGQALQEFKFFADPRQRPTPEGAAKSPARAAHDGGDAAASAASTSRAATSAASAASTAGAAPADGGNDADSAPRLQAPPAPHMAPQPAQGNARKDTRAAAARTTAPTPAPAAAAAAAKSAAASAAPASSAPAGDTAAADAANGDNVIKPRSLPDSPKGAAKRGTPAAGAAATTGAADAAGGGAGEVVIQVFSSADREQADRVRGSLVDSGFQAFLSPIAKNGQTMYRVRIGPFATRSAAEPVAEKVRKEQKLDTWITPK